MMKRYFSMLLVVVIAFMLVSCASSETGGKDETVTAAYKYSVEGDLWDDFPRPSKPEKSYTIGVLLPMIANPHFVAQSYGYYDEAEKLGAEVVLLECGGALNSEKQIQQAEDLITLPVDAIVLVATDYDSTVPIVNKANAAGIPVVNVNIMTNSEDVVTRIRSDDAVIGSLQADYHAEKLGPDGGNVLMINGVAGASWAIGRSGGYKDRVAEKGYKINVLDERWCDEDPGAVLKEMDDAIQTYGEEIDCVYTPGEVFAKAVVQSVKAAGLIDKIIVTSVDPSEDGIALVKEGSIDMMVVQSSVTMGRYGIRAAVMALEGKAAEIKKRIWTPIWSLTSENIDSFDFVDINTPPKDWRLP